MPIQALPVSRWEKQIHDYTTWVLTFFGRGERPRKDSLWAKVLATVESCPLFCSGGQHGIFGAGKSAVAPFTLL